MRGEKVTYTSGTSIRYQIAIKNSGAAKNTGLYETDSVNVADVMTSADVPWRHTTTNYAFDRREISMNREPARLFDLVRLRRGDAITSLAEKFEDNLWGTPSTSADTSTPWGINYWLPAGSGVTATGNDDGFNGEDPFGHSSTAGIVRASNPRFQHWVGGFDRTADAPSAATGGKRSFVQAMRKAMTYCKFMPPANLPSYDSGYRYGIYTNYEVIAKAEEFLRDQNDTLGMDIAATDGKLLFRGIPFQWVPWFDPESGGNPYYADNGAIVSGGTAGGAWPIIGIDWGTTNLSFLAGEDMREHVDRSVSGQHNVTQVHMDSTYNLCMKNPRRCFVLHDPTTSA